MNKRPEYMILVAVIAALVVSIIASAVSCATITGAIEDRINGSTPGYNSIIEDIEGGEGANPSDILDELTGNGGGDGESADDEKDREGSGDYTEKDVPKTMVIDVPELTDDLQACLNSDLYGRLGSTVTVELSTLTKEDTAAPELKGNRVLSKATGTVDIKTSDGKSGTVEYTSYYYAQDPTADTITWYIYAYDLSSYDLFPSGFDKVAGDPMGVRDRIDSGIPAPNSELGRDNEFNSETA
ncbi:MAG: hypothetical protein Q4D27_08945 [Coriobacteriia bacterium]|nr:hypothetical protein [Coriobacteriia bacterium]